MVEESLVKPQFQNRGKESAYSEQSSKDIPFAPKPSLLSQVKCDLADNISTTPATTSPPEEAAVQRSPWRAHRRPTFDIVVVVVLVVVSTTPAGPSIIPVSQRRVSQHQSYHSLARLRDYCSSELQVGPSITRGNSLVAETISLRVKRSEEKILLQKHIRQFLDTTDLTRGPVLGQCLRLPYRPTRPQ
jgi:hypothetical protein